MYFVDTGDTDSAFIQLIKQKSACIENYVNFWHAICVISFFFQG